jgi:hypothetical protein
MGSITTARYVGEGNPKNTIKILGIGLKQDPDVSDVELSHPVLKASPPDGETGFGPFECAVFAPTFNSSLKNVSIRMKDEDGNWTNQVPVSV